MLYDIACIVLYTLCAVPAVEDSCDSERITSMSYCTRGTMLISVLTCVFILMSMFVSSCCAQVIPPDQVQKGFTNLVDSIGRWDKAWEMALSMRRWHQSQECSSAMDRYCQAKEGGSSA